MIARTMPSGYARRSRNATVASRKSMRVWAHRFRKNKPIERRAVATPPTTAMTPAASGNRTNTPSWLRTPRGRPLCDLNRIEPTAAKTTPERRRMTLRIVRDRGRTPSGISRYSRRSSGGIRGNGNRTVPAEGFVSPRRVRPTVVFPHPLSPTSPRVSPRRISKSTPSTARTNPAARRNSPPRIEKYFRSLRTWTRRSSATDFLQDRVGPPARFVEQARDAVAGLGVEGGRLRGRHHRDADLVRGLFLDRRIRRFHGDDRANRGIRPVRRDKPPHELHGVRGDCALRESDPELRLPRRGPGHRIGVHRPPGRDVRGPREPLQRVRDLRRGPSARWHPLRASRVEPAPRRGRDQVRDGAADDLEPLPPHRVGRNRLHQPLRVGVEGRLEHLPYLCVLRDDPRVHHADAVAHLRDDPEVVRDDQNARTEGRLHVLDQLEDLRLDRDVERRRRLVRDQETRVTRERDRDHGPLLHAPAQFVRVLPRDPLRVRDLHLPEHLDGPQERLLLQGAFEEPPQDRRGAAGRVCAGPPGVRQGGAPRGGRGLPGPRPAAPS